MLNANFGYQIRMTVDLTVEMLPTEKSSIRDNGLQAPLMIEWGVGGRDGRRGCLRPRRAGAAHELAPDPFPRGARAQCRAACRGRARPAGETRRTRGRTRARRAGAHGLGAPAQARVRARSRTLPAVWGDMKIIAANEEPAVIVRIFLHLGLPAGAPPLSSARLLELFEAA